MTPSASRPRAASADGGSGGGGTGGGGEDSHLGGRAESADASSPLQQQQALTRRVGQGGSGADPSAPQRTRSGSAVSVPVSASVSVQRGLGKAMQQQQRWPAVASDVTTLEGGMARNPSPLLLRPFTPLISLFPLALFLLQQ